MFNLSKDQSLRSMLAKADLDENTSTLLKADAPIYEIRQSLVENMNSSNIVKYRRLIQKADDEEKKKKEAERKKKEAEDKKAKEMEEETRKLIGEDESEEVREARVQSEASQKERDVKEAEAGDIRQFEKDKKSKASELRSLRSILPLVEEMMQKMTKTKGGNYRSVEFNRLGRGKGKKENIMSLLGMGTDRIKTKYGKYITESDGKDFIIPRSIKKDSERTKENPFDTFVEEKDKAVNVTLLDKQIDRISAMEFEGMKTLDVMGELYTQEYGTTPTFRRGGDFKTRRKRELEESMDLAQGISPREERNFQKLKKTILRIESHNEEAMLISSRIEKLQEELNDTDSRVEDIISAKIKEIESKIRESSPSVSARTPSKKYPEYSETRFPSSRVESKPYSEERERLMQELFTVRDNSERFVAMAKKEVEDAIEKEKEQLAKLGEVGKMDAITRPVFKRIKEIVRLAVRASSSETRVDEDDLARVTQLSKFKLNKANSLLLRIKTLSRKIARASSQIEDQVSEEISELENLTKLVSEGEIQLEMLDVVDETKVEKEVSQNIKELEEKVEELDLLLNEYEYTVGEQKEQAERNQVFDYEADDLFDYGGEEE